MQNKQYTRTKGPTIVTDEFTRTGNNSPEKFPGSNNGKRTSASDFLPYWQWKLLEKTFETRFSSLNNGASSKDEGIKIHEHYWRKSKYHTTKVAVITLIVTPIILRAIPVVLDFYLGR